MLDWGESATRVEGGRMEGELGMNESKPTREEIELAIWRVTGTRHASEVDRLLAMVDAYAAQPEPVKRMSAEEEEHLFDIMREIQSGLPTVDEMRADLATGDNGAAQPVVSGRPSDEGGTKPCSLCKQVKPLASFASDRTAKTGKRSRCRTCESRRKL